MIVTEIGKSHGRTSLTWKVHPRYEVLVVIPEGYDTEGWFVIELWIWSVPPTRKKKARKKK